MSTDQPSESECESGQEVTMLELLVLVLSVYVLLSMLAELFVSMSAEMKHLLTLIDYGVCAVFLTEFFIRLWRAPSKARFMRWGWIDLVSSIPYGALQAGRVVRVVRILRILRSVRELMKFLRRRKRNTLAFLTICAGILTLIFSTIAVLAFEDDPASNIKSPGDAIWWAFTTMTTVGYGDRFPVTAEGRVVAVLLMIVGVGIFSVLTGLLARFFLEPDVEKEDSDIRRLTEEVRRLRESVERLSTPQGRE